MSEHNRHKAAVVQMVSTANMDDNLASADRLVAEAVRQGATLVLLPENFAVLDGGPQAARAEREGDTVAPLQRFLSGLARSHGIWLVGGTMPMLTRPQREGEAAEVVGDGRVRPASLVFDNEGRQVARYDKIHLFDVQVDDVQSTYSESRSFEPGETVETVDTPVGHVGLSICYDLRFPELYRRLMEEGAELFTVPSAFTQVTGSAHWEVLLRARAIENQCYVLAANQGGVHNATRETFGHSMIVDAWGRVLACVEKGEGVAVAEIDLSAMHELRGKMPVRQHRRL